MNEYVEYFTSRKPAQCNRRFLKWWHKRMLKIAAQYIPGFCEKTILEIGAGHGFIADICYQNQIAYLGHEMNTAQALELSNLGYRVTPATIPPIPSGPSTQVVWLSHILEHAVTYREAKEMLHACYDRLDPDGYIVIIAPDVLHWKGAFWSVDWSHGFPTSLNRVEQLLSETKFIVHKSMHHTFTQTQPLLAWSLSWLFRIFLPVYFLDFFLHKLFKRKLCQSFMSVFGLRQIYLIGRKKC